MTLIDATGQVIDNIETQPITKKKKSILSFRQNDVNLKSNQPQQNTTLNPFNNQQIDSDMPTFNNGPMTEESQMVNSLLNDNNVPLSIKRKHWWVFSRDNSLTFLDEQRKRDKMVNFDIIKIDTLNALPYYEYTFEVEKEINILRNAIEVKYDRALGTTKAAQLNERIAQKSQFNEHRQISKDESSNSQAGFIGKLLNRR